MKILSGSERSQIFGQLQTYFTVLLVEYDQSAPGRTRPAYWPEAML
jgi:hypothetical protein